MMQQEPVTILITRQIRSGEEHSFEEKVKVWIQRALKYPGYLGVHMLRPMPGSREYGAVIKFCTRDDWHAFRDSAEYREFVESLRPMLESEPQIETICGLESWFTPLGQQLTRVPPRWKMAVVTWLGVSLTVYLVSWLLSPMTMHWPTLVAYLFANAVVVSALTWIVMPLLSRVFHPWLLSVHRPVTGVH